jgi:anaerobic selenocysteine-containing dehydrogenase
VPPGARVSPAGLQPGQGAPSLETEWERISWQDAAGLLAARIEGAVRRFGPRSLLFFNDAGSIAALKLVNRRFFNLLGGGTFASGSLCGGAGIAGQTIDFGVRTSHDPADLANAKLILIWGRNPAWTNVHVVPLLREARARETQAILIDPVVTATARLCDRHAQPAPGTDRFLALGMARVLLDEGLVDAGFLEAHTEGADEFFSLAHRYPLKKISEITGLTINNIKELAVIYGESRPAAILGGWGIQRWRRGGETYRFLDALGALTGNLGIPGGGVSHGMDETRWFSRHALLEERGTDRREIPRPRIGAGIREAVDPAIRVAVICGANPIAQCPSTERVREAFRSLDFVAVVDMFMTDTAQVADLVLPTTHFLQERDMVASYWHNFVMPVNVAQSRLGEEKADLEIFALLADRLGFGREFPGDPDFYLAELARPLAGMGVDLARIMEGPVRSPGAVEIPFGGGLFPTPSGRFRFVSRITEPETDSSAYPLRLLSPHPHARNHSQLAGVPGPRLPEVRIAPGAARGLGVAEGQTVAVESPHGKLVCRVVLTDKVRSDTALIYEGWWDRLGGSVNRLTSDALTDVGESASYYDVRCRLVGIDDER